MFFKSNTPENARSNATVPSRSAVPSLLSGDIRIKGGVTSSGEVHVDGVIEGDVSAKTLIISERGVINGAVVAQAVRVLGSVNGTISARSVLLARSARVVGDIIHAVLAIEEGAFLRGHCRRAEPEEQGEIAEAPGAAERSTDFALSRDETHDEELALAEEDRAPLVRLN